MNKPLSQLNKKEHKQALKQELKRMAEKEGLHQPVLSLPIVITKDSRKCYELLPSKNTRQSADVETMVKVFHEVEENTKYFDDGKLHIKKRTPMSYEICCDESDIRFFLTMPTLYTDYVTETVRKTWEGSDAVETDDCLELFESGNTTFCEMSLGKHFILPMMTPSQFGGGSGGLMGGGGMGGPRKERAVEPLNSILSVAQSLREGERFLFQLLFYPVKDYAWKISGAEFAEQIKNGGSPEVKPLGYRVLDFIYEEVMALADDFLEGVFGFKSDSSNKDNAPMNRGLGRGGYRQQYRQEDMQAKLSCEGFKCHMRFYISSPDRRRRTSIQNNLISALKTVEGQNELKVGKFKTITGAEGLIREANPSSACVLSTSEISQIVALPDKMTQDRFGRKIKKIENDKLTLGESFYSGRIPIGYTNPSFRPRMAYWDVKNLNQFVLPKLIMGGMGSGKSTYIQNYIVGAQKTGHGVIVFDYIGHCQATRELEPYLDMSKTIIFDAAKDYRKFGFTYEELYINWEEKSYQDRRNTAQTIGVQILEVMNAQMDGENPVPALKEGYIPAIARVVFVHRGTTLKDFFDVLSDHNIRRQFIEKGKAFPPMYDENGVEDTLLSDSDIQELARLDKKDKDGNVIGTNGDQVNPILSRQNTFKKDDRLRQMYEAKNGGCYINFMDLLTQNKTLIVRIGTNTFSDKSVQSTIITFISSKIWLLKRTYSESPEMQKSITHLIYDEVFNIPGTMTYLTGGFTEFRKYQIAPVMAAHRLGQFPDDTLKQINSATPHYILLSLTDEDSLKKLGERLKPLTIEECMQLKQFHAVNIINMGQKWETFVTRCPGRITDEPMVTLKPKKNIQSNKKAGTLEEIINTPFEEVMQGESATKSKRGWLQRFKRSSKTVASEATIEFEETNPEISTTSPMPEIVDLKSKTTFAEVNVDDKKSPKIEKPIPTYQPPLKSSLKADLSTVREGGIIPTEVAEKQSGIRPCKVNTGHEFAPITPLNVPTKPKVRISSTKK